MPGKRSTLRTRTDLITQTRCAPTKAKGSRLTRTTHVPWVVGVGLSAGSVGAFEQILATIPAGCAMAFVLAGALDAGERAALVARLGKRAHLLVTLAKDGAPLRAHSVYVSPPDADVALEEGHLRVVPYTLRSKQEGPIDRLFRSLARDRGRWATAIVLQSPGMDGARGLEAIRRAGGFAVGQPGRRARGRASEAGAVDRQAPLERMYEVLQTHLVDLAAESLAEATPESVVRRASRLEQELLMAKELLATSHEELQTTNEELRSSNEELLSTNEELGAVNARLLEKVAEATQASNDVANLLASTDIATILLDPDLRISRFTPSATAVFALQAGDTGRPLAEIRMLTDYPRFFDDARSVAAGGRATEAQTRGGGRELVARLTPYRTQEGHAQGVVATFVDVTSLELARAELRENAEQVNALFAHVAVGIAVTDMDGRIVDVNPATCTMLGWSREALLGRRFAPDGHPDDGRREQEMLGELVAGRRSFYHTEERYLCADGGLLWARVSVSIVRPGGGGAARVVHVLQDVSEARRVEKQLRAQESLARLGEMAAAIAHEVRSPLMAVLAAVDILATRVPEGDSERRVVGEIRRRIASVDGLVRDLLQFARPTDLRFTRVHLRALLQEASDLLRRSGEMGEVVVTLSGDGVEVLGDAELLRSVFTNLANNAAQAMKGKGILSVDLVQEGNVCTVAFRDTGPGVPAPVAARIFEPFFTTRSRGIGLGLSLAKRIVEAHGGDIALLPSEGSGTTILVTLPMASS